MKLGTILKHRSKSTFAERAWRIREARLGPIAIESRGDRDRFEAALEIAIANRRVKDNDIADCVAIVEATLPFLEGIMNRRRLRRVDLVNRCPALFAALNSASAGAETRDAVVGALLRYAVAADGRCAENT